MKESGDIITFEELIQPCRITALYQNTIKDLGNFSEMNVHTTVEPIEIKVGFREIDFFKRLGKVF